MKKKAEQRKARLPRLILAAKCAVLLIFFGSGIATAQSVDIVKISGLPYLSYAPIFIAVEEGYFAEQGIELEFVRFDRVGRSMPALARGDLDVSADSIGSSLFSAIARGLELKIVADKGHVAEGCSSSAIMVRKDLYDRGELNTLAQLKGRKVALAAVPIWGYVYETILAGGQLTLDDIEIVNMPGPARIAALKSGAIDAAGAAEPMITQLETLGIGVVLAPYQDFVPGFHVSCIIFGPNLLEKNPRLGRRFMVAYLEGVRQYNEGKSDRNIEIIQKHTKLSADVLREACFVSIYSDGHVDTGVVQAVQNWTYDRGFTDSKVPIDQVVDMSFVDYANKTLEMAR